MDTLPAWAIVDLWPPTTMSPLRATPSLEATSKRTVPLPLPVIGDVRAIQLTLVVAAHAQSVPVVAVMASAVGPPAAGTLRLEGATSNLHCARCDTRTRCALTTMSPSRGVVPSFAATPNSTVRVPWPDAGDNPEIHSAADVAFQAHSGSVVTVKLPLPPIESRLVGGVNAS